MPRVKLFDEEKALNQAMELFWEKGYHNTSLSDLTSTLKIGKGSFYDTFSGKKPLFEKAFTAYRTENVAMLKQMLSTQKDVKKGMRNLLEGTMNNALADTKRKGCFIANTCAEMGNSDAEIQPLLVAHQEEVLEIFQDYLKDYSFGSGISAKQMASLIMTFLTGMNQEVKIKKDASAIQPSIDALLRLM